MKLVYQYIAIFFTFSPTSNHFIHCKSRIATASRNSRLVVDEDDNDKFRLERVKGVIANTISSIKWLKIFYVK